MPNTEEMFMSLPAIPNQLALALLVAAASLPAAATTSTYANTASFEAATKDLLDHNFEGIAATGSSLYIGGPLTVGPLSFTSNGNKFVIDKTGGFGEYGASKFDSQTALPTQLIVSASVTGNVTAVSFDVGSYIGIFGVDVSVNGTTVYSFMTPSNPGVGVTFFGITSTVPITSLSFFTTSNPLNNSSGGAYVGLDFTNFQTGTALLPAANVPEPAIGSLLASGLAVLGLLCLRRQRNL